MYLTVREVAQRLQKSEETIKRWIRTGKYPNAVKTSDREGWRIPVSDINDEKHIIAEKNKIPSNLRYFNNSHYSNEKELVILAFQAVTLTYPSDEIIQVLDSIGIKRTLEVLLIMQQSPTKVKNPLGFIKRAVSENWTFSTLPQKTNRRIQNFDKKHGFDPVSLPNNFSFYNWLEAGEDE